MKTELKKVRAQYLQLVADYYTEVTHACTGRILAAVVLFIASLFLAACPSGYAPVAATCEPPVINYGPCPQEVRDWTRVQGPGVSEPQIISNEGAKHEASVIQPGTCVYTDPCGKAWRVQGCYLADGYVCP
jgi:hypothetical protein